MAGFLDLLVWGQQRLVSRDNLLLKLRTNMIKNDVFDRSELNGGPYSKSGPQKQVRSVTAPNYND